MKLKIEANVTGDEIVNEYILPNVKSKGVDGTVENVKVQVQNKNNEWVDVTPSKVRFIFNKE